MKPFEPQKIRNMALQRKKKRTLTIREKKALITEYLSENGKYHQMSYDMIAREEDLSHSTVKRLIRNSDQIMATEAAIDRKMFRTRTTVELEKHLFQWIIDMRQKRIPLSGFFIRQKALRMNDVYKIPNFKAQHSWFRYFTRKMKLSLRTRVGHSDFADKDAANHWLVGTLKFLLLFYHPDDIFNMDETALFVDAVPRTTYDAKGKQIHDCRDTKRRVTIALCANMSGSEKRPLHMISTAAHPRCFGPRSNPLPLNVRYDSAVNGWMTKTILMNWLKDWNEELKEQNRQVVLIMDNASSHGKIDDEGFEHFKNIRIVFLPPNLTSLIQPLDSGIIALFKHKYRTRMVDRMISNEPVLTKIDEIMKLSCISELEMKSMMKQRRNLTNINLYEVQDLIEQCWREISADSIRRCFRKAGWRDELVNSEDNSFLLLNDDSHAEDNVNKMFCEIDEILLSRHVTLDDLNEEIHLDEMLLKDLTNADVEPVFNEMNGDDVEEEVNDDLITDDHHNGAEQVAVNFVDAQVSHESCDSDDDYEDCQDS